MIIKFTKMHGAGNDYIFINCFEQKINCPSELAKKLSNRNYSIGSDGLILVYPIKGADAEMRMYNPDGSESKMCGNGIRCVAKFVVDNIIKKTPETIAIVSHGKRYSVKLIYDNKKNIVCATIDMGIPMLKSTLIPSTIKVPEIREYDIYILDKNFKITCVNVGNPHTVIYVDDVKSFDVEKYGSFIEKLSLFPERTNVEFVEVLTPNEVIQRTWERGAGETLACGSGASAVCVAGIRTGKTKSPLLVHLKGGDLTVTWIEGKNLFLTGPATETFHGEIEVFVDS